MFWNERVEVFGAENTRACCSFREGGVKLFHPLPLFAAGWLGREAGGVKDRWFPRSTEANERLFCEGCCMPRAAWDCGGVKVCHRVVGAGRRLDCCAGVREKDEPVLAARFDPKLFHPARVFVRGSEAAEWFDGAVKERSPFAGRAMLFACCGVFAPNREVSRDPEAFARDDVKNLAGALRMVEGFAARLVGE